MALAHETEIEDGGNGAGPPPSPAYVSQSSRPVKGARTRQAAGRVRVRTLVITRWLAVSGQAATLLIVEQGLGASVPMTGAMAIVGVSALLNVWISLFRGLAGWYSDRAAAAYLAYDVLQLAVLLYLTGGLGNPFALLILVPVTISATILSLGSTLGLGFIGFLAASLLAWFHLPLPWPGGSLNLPTVYVIGTWVAISLGMAFVVFYAWRVAAEARRMADALAETQLALAREQELSSLGTLAAAAAHELGTPLSTIALIAKELVGDLPADSDLAEDARLLHDQSERCRVILARLAQEGRLDSVTGLGQAPLPDVIAGAAADFDHRPARIAVVRNGQGAPPLVQRSPELVQGLTNLIENASDFARTAVSIEAQWNEQEIVLRISDDGPGFAADVLASLGDPYFTTRRESGGMGLGVFISKTLLERTGAEVRFANRRRPRGAMVVIRWPRRVLEITGDSSGEAGSA